ncbi:DUF4268 domain-containing protein [Frigidibacter sp. MR17.24]|uniref:DUF4268 domain-containing protein n=1 Tax=Frigidibacter sp. MR17.24 TaxID=3127345 RepID=UPI003012B294
MFRVDRPTNRISRLSQKRFGELGFTERRHLQEWLVHQPDALGEELLILQKEFDGFDETKERLDLLALDKAGNLVVIENKLDDSGRDVVWQALKYAAYTSGLKKAQIVEIHQKYLNDHCGGGDAAQAISDFLEVEDLSGTVLNPGNGQRILFVAANFRREVTATALWLISRGIAVQCFRVTPFGFGEELFLDLQQIIPPPEAADYMIGISSKEVEETAVQGTQKKRYDLRQQFWSLMLERLRADKVEIYANISPTTQHWLSAGSGVRSCPYQLIFGRDEARVELSLSRSEGAENKWLFDQLVALRPQIEEAFGAPLEWRRMDDKKQSRILYSCEFDGYNRDSWPAMMDWLSAHVRRLETAFHEPLSRLGRQVRAYDEDAE